MSDVSPVPIAGRPSRIAIDDATSVSGLYVEATAPFACCALAPGAGAGMTHPFMAAVAAATRVAGHLPLFAGGKSFGGRMTSQAQAATPLPGVHGLFFLGFPLHPANKPATARALHLRQVEVPMIFVQGTRDALAETNLMRRTIADLPAACTLYEIEGGDHAMHVPKRSGLSDAAALDGALDATADWMQRIVSRR